MKRRRFSEEKIVMISKEEEAGKPAKEVIREHGISEATFYIRRKNYNGLERSDLQKLRALEDENRRLKKLVADQALDNQAIREVVKKSGKDVGPP